MAKRPRNTSATHSQGLLYCPFTVPAEGTAGLDEAGRGCLAGPVVAAAVILPPHVILTGLNDSKVLSAKQRACLAPQIKAEALAWSVGLSWPREIERCNILQATFHAMSRAVRTLRVQPVHLLIDGNKSIPRPLLQQYCAAFSAGVPSQHTIVGGDALEAAISAASILAKTFRDQIMDIFHTHYPLYGFIRHKGYGTKEHFAAIRQHGPCPLHRMTFAGVLPPPAVAGP
ncbi:MAG: ribonuclease HII, partial [Desulfovibrionaceae bacterium]